MLLYIVMKTICCKIENPEYAKQESDGFSL